MKVKRNRFNSLAAYQQWVAVEEADKRTANERARLIKEEEDDRNWSMANYEREMNAEHTANTYKHEALRRQGTAAILCARQILRQWHLLKLNRAGRLLYREGEITLRYHGKHKAWVKCLIKGNRIHVFLSEEQGFWSANSYGVRPFELVLNINAANTDKNTFQFVGAVGIYEKRTRAKQSIELHYNASLSDSELAHIGMTKAVYQSIALKQAHDRAEQGAQREARVFAVYTGLPPMQVNTAYENAMLLKRAKESQAAKKFVEEVDSLRARLDALMA